ncbi:hypothetical protein L1987_07094 [Smallanthus sonchifolius]|uniref:Uncharacterized protein n=1 Tax=Smallanthus sonchifolius TaxID=185202 RepID=A0ACB9JZW3_9ASTR|nr:hypothetical protein L1987_07094 [Smallanthus sonchifolius]
MGVLTPEAISIFPPLDLSIREIGRRTMISMRLLILFGDDYRLVNHVGQIWVPDRQDEVNEEEAGHSDGQEQPRYEGESYPGLGDPDIEVPSPEGEGRGGDAPPPPPVYSTAPLRIALDNITFLGHIWDLMQTMHQEL